MAQSAIWNPAGKSSLALTAGLLVAAADVHHPVSDRRFGLRGLPGFLGFSRLLGGRRVIRYKVVALFSSFGPDIFRGIAPSVCRH